MKQEILYPALHLLRIKLKVAHLSFHG